MKYVFFAIVFLAGMGRAYAECPTGYTFNTALKKCEIAPTCPSGFSLHKENDICYKATDSGRCPEGSTYNQKEKICETQLLCPAGTVFNADIEKCLKK
ncbi:MAG TPA: hypothetical protein VK187_07805 [Geobacteraceae bacterium]|nr:hypothetical protein [Geobacteraceae bacterium]